MHEQQNPPFKSTLKIASKSGIIREVVRFQADKSKKGNVSETWSNRWVDSSPKVSETWSKRLGDSSPKV